MSRATLCFSMYSLMSMRTMACSSSNRNSASARASSVLPTPVGPRKMKEPTGRFSSCNPARARRTAFDTAVMAVAMLGISTPVFYSALLLILFFSFTLAWFPATGQGGPERLVLPATALGLSSAAVLARLVRSSMLDVLHQEYVVTARAKGLAPTLVLLRHALKNALIPAVTMLGLQLGALLGGAVVTETIFSRPGVGRLAVDAILNRDFPLVQGTVLFAAATYVLVNLAVDVSYAIIDPRIRYR